MSQPYTKMYHVYLFICMGNVGKKHDFFYPLGNDMVGFPFQDVSQSNDLFFLLFHLMPYILGRSLIKVFFFI